MGADDVTGDISFEELQLAARNHGMPLEMLRHDITPVGMHYLLIHYDIPQVDPATWRLEVGGAVRTPLSLSLGDLRARTSITMPVTFECAGNGRARMEPRAISQPWLLEAVGTGEWTGVKLSDVLGEAEPADDAIEFAFEGLDRGIESDVEQSYERGVARDVAMNGDALLAYEMNGSPLPPQHGFPLRLVVPGWYGMTNVKWLRRITALTEPFGGYQNVRSYRMREHEDDEGVPVSTMVPRALMIPPGIPEFLTRARRVGRVPCTIEGKAWSGNGPIDRVQVSDDDSTWRDAELSASVGPHAWRPWRFDWNPKPGIYRLRCRARDATGAEQPDDPAWNVGGYANNAVQTVTVEVTG